MAKFPTYEEMGKKVAEEALDGFIYKDKTLREWIDILAQTRWIPVSERLPEEMGAYMTTVDYGKHGLAIAQRYYHGKDLGWEDDYVIAWKPLPEPYKAESEGKK